MLIQISHASNRLVAAKASRSLRRTGRRRTLYPTSYPVPLFDARNLPFSEGAVSTIAQVSAPCSALEAHPAAATAISAATAVAPSATPPLSHLLVAFLAGGMFFSAVIASAVAFIALGAENFKRVLDVRRLVVRRVWGIFTLGLGAARAALLGSTGREAWNWSDGWRVLREKMVETRRAAAEGVEAIRLEASLYAAAMGKPGLIALQYFVDHLTPKYFAATLEESLRDALSTIQDKNVKKVELEEFSVGRKLPELLDARVYELGDDAMAFDIDVRWESEIEAKMLVKSNRLGVTIPLSVKNARFIGVVRVVLAPLTPEPPGFGAALISLPSAPKIGLDVHMAGGEITRMPWLRSEIMSTIQVGIENEYLWPRRMVIPSPAPAKTRKVKTMLSKQELTELSMSDPLLRAEREVAKKPEYQRSQLERIHSMPKPESLRMNVLVKDDNCDEEEDYCVIDNWDSPEASGNFEDDTSWATANSWTRAFVDRAFEAVRNSTAIASVLGPERSHNLVLTP